MISAVTTTWNLPQLLEATLESLVEGSLPPNEFIIIDASDDWRNLESFAALCTPIPIHHHPATVRGAAAQRNQGVSFAKGEHMLFVDDNIVADRDCLLHLRKGLETDQKIGETCATITNQTYSPPGKLSALLFRWLNRQELPSYARRCIGPAKTFHPAMDDTLPAIVPVDWLPTTAILYRKEA